MSERPILLTGVNGQVGGEIFRLLSPLSPVIAPTRDQLDLADADAIRSFVMDLKPRWIVNPAAYTAVDRAESESELAYRINAEAPRVLGEVAAELQIPLIHFSTDYVFTGEGTAPWQVDSPTGPQNVYGASKLAGERALLASGATAFLFRTSWVYGSTGKNFVRTILRLVDEKEELNIVGDQFGAPTWSRDLARLAVHTMEKADALAEDRASLVAITGIYHACDGGETTWFGFAAEILRLAKEKEPGRRIPALYSVPSSAYPTPAKRPQNSRMDCGRLTRDLQFTMPQWQESLASVMREI